MEIVTTAQPTEFRLREDFLAPYRQKQDPFQSLLARSTYLTKYCRDSETWTDTVRRVVEGNMSLSSGGSNTEAELLFHLFWTGQALPPGRGLWVGGIPGIPSDARYNCWYTTLYGTDDWCWIANQLMLGGGVGVGLREIDKLPDVLKGNARIVLRCGASHPNRDEVKPDDNDPLNGNTKVFEIPDSREGWVEAIRTMLTHAFNGVDLIVDLNHIRPRGTPLKTFGGIACGPGPLAHLLRQAWTIIRGAQGRKLTSVEALDVTNHIGLCVKSGNVRRSAMITLGGAYDQAFRDAKKDIDAVISHRHTSNNSIAFQSWDEINNFDWASLVEDNSVYGEPGILNLPLGWQTDPGVKGVNPCGEQLLHDREACNLAEVFPAKFEAGLDPVVAFRLVTRYCLRQRLTPLLDSQSQSVGTQNMRIGVGLGGICDFEWSPEMLAEWFGVCRKEADDYADELGVNRPATVTTVKPSGTVSLLNGSSPGIHSPHSPFYLRRTRIAKNDPMAGAMIEAGVPYEEDVYDKSGNTWVFSFPTKAPHTTVTKNSESLRGQFERQAAVQEWWADNAVSATLNFDAETERGELAACLKEFVPKLKSTSCLPKSHGYEQPPYEEIDEITFKRMSGYINHEHPLVAQGEIEVADSCSSGACPIR